MAKSTHSAIADPRNENVKIYINGEFHSRENAQISVFDSGFLVGDGIWEGLRLHNGKFAFLDKHLDRLFAGASAIHLDIGLNKEELVNALLETVEINEMTDDAHVRIMITRGNKKTPSQHPSNVIGGPNIVIIAEHKVADPSISQEGITLFTVTVRRPPPDTLDQRLNCHSKLHEVIALIQAIEAGADEALMLDPTGSVATCNATNFFIIKNEEVWTSTGEYCLNGITRELIIEIARNNGMKAFEKPFSLTDVYSANEAFVTGTFGGLTPVTQVDGRKIADGRIGNTTMLLQDLYKEVVNAEVSK